MQESDPWINDITTNNLAGVWLNEATDANVINPLPPSNLLTLNPLTSVVNERSLTSETENTVKNGYNNMNLSPVENISQSIWDDQTKQPFVSETNSLDPLIESNMNMDLNKSKNEDLNNWYQVARKNYNPLSINIILVEEIPEREGLLFKHTNYLVKHLVALPNTMFSKDGCVIRRYSDFNWLREVLLKKYPFRMIPELPPKRIGSQNSDPIFLLKRCDGLNRFLNLIMKHPILKDDDLVLTFLAVPTDLSNWRKQASYDTTDEFTDKKIAPSFIKMWKNELSEQWDEANANIDSTIESWVKITILIERYEKRIKQIAEERKLLSTIMEDFGSKVPSLYSIDQGSINDINNHITMVSRHLLNCVDLTDEENKEVVTQLLVKFKMFVDVIISLKGLFERYKTMTGNNIPQLQRRIEINSEKLNTMRGNPDVKGTEYDRLKQFIQKDKRTIAEELNRNWLIRECILEEFTIFQETQFCITHVFQNWTKSNLKYSNKNTDIWEKLLNNLNDMPIARN